MTKAYRTYLQILGILLVLTILVMDYKYKGIKEVVIDLFLVGSSFGFFYWLRRQHDRTKKPTAV